MKSIELKRYDRHIKLPEVGPDGQLKLTNARVLVIGAGGLGCPVLQLITAAGVGEVGIVDGDTISISNIQRQFLYREHDIGKNKAIVASEVLKQINPHINIIVYEEFLNQSNALKWFAEYDLIVDCTDNFGTRYLINDACVLCDKPFVFAALYKFQGQFGVFNLVDTNGERTANYRDFFTEDVTMNSIPDCSAVGVYSLLPSLIGNFQANEILKYFLFPERCLRNEIVFFDARSLEIQQLKIDKISNANVPVRLDEFLSRSYDVPCSLDKQVSVQGLKDSLIKPNVVLFDIREINEYPGVELESIQKHPFSDFSGLVEKVNSFLHQNKEVIVFCQSGQRARKFCEKMNEEINCRELRYFSGDVTEIINLLQSN